jgi:2-oxoisovalerate ferredoxin oxidoreductase beta subunit
MAELLSTLEAPVYVERVALNDNKNVMKTRKAVRKALELQRDGTGFSFLEILSPCPTIWKMTPQESRTWIEEKMMKVFPLGVYRDRKSDPMPDGVPQTTVSKLLKLDGEETVRERSAAREQNLDLRINIAGFGGQGVLLLGQILAEMGMREGREVSWLPSYGPEMRSGSAHCYVCLSNERVGSPLAEHPDVLIAMNEISLRKFAKDVGTDGTILYNGAKLPDGFPAPQAHVLCIPAAELADKLGTAKVANVVMLGGLLELTHTMPKEMAFTVLKAKVRNAKLLDLDYQAIEAGIESVRQQMSAALAGAVPGEAELAKPR